MFTEEKKRDAVVSCELYRVIFAGGHIYSLCSLPAGDHGSERHYHCIDHALVPGVAITNAVYDTLHGDYISGAARMLEAFVTAAAIAIGVGLGMLLLRPLVR